MSNVSLKTRIKHKYDTPENWAKATNFIPLEGEICIYNNGTGVKPEMKIGDGTTLVGELPFLKAGGDVTIAASATTGTKVGTISIDGVATDLYAGAVTWSNVTNKPSYYDAKAITGITRNGLTFTATHADGTQSQFTQQDTDTNTTYTAGTGLSLSGTTFSINNNKVFMFFDRNDIGAAPNFDNPGVNGLFEMRSTTETPDQTGDRPFEGFAPFISIKASNTMFQLVSSSSQGFFIRGVQKTNVTLEGVAWQKIITNSNYTDYTVTKTGSGASGTWGISVTGSATSCTGNSATATALTTSAGSSTVPVYFSGGKPVQCSTTLGVNITGSSASCTGNAYSASILSTNSTANLSSCLQYFQSSSQTAGSDLPTETWWHIIKMNHGTGDSYYKRLLAFSFFSNDIRVAYKSGESSDHTTTWVSLWKQGDSVTGAVWNDYAEYRESEDVQFGRVLYEKGDDTLAATTERLQPFAGISSDTWGFCQGETERAKTPIAVAGRVLAYTYRNRDEYQPGDCLCAAPNGTVDIMTREEVERYPDRIVGTVSCVPTYEEWGKGDRPAVKVDGRIWVKVR